MSHKDRKIGKKRGSRTCGWGNAQKHRGAGSRGGRGMGGSNKQKWSWVSKFEPKRFGRRGFKRPPSAVKIVRTINIGALADQIERLVAEGKAKKGTEGFEIELTAIGCDKLLGTGRVTIPIKIIAGAASSKAVEKISAAGGNVVLPEEGSEAAKDELEAPEEDDRSIESEDGNAES